VRRVLILLSALSVVALLALGTGPSALGATGPGGARPGKAAMSGVTTADPSVIDLAKERGVSLSEAQRRIEWQQRAVELDKHLQARLGSRYGGLWIGSADDRVKVGLVGGGDVRADAGRFGLADATDVVAVRYSAAYLQAASDWLGDQVVRVNAGAQWPLGSGLLPNRNAVELLLPQGKPLAPAQQALVRAATKRFGAALRLGALDGDGQATACNYPDCDPPLRGGLYVQNNNAACTSGFIAQSKVDSTKYLIIAGHCIFASGTNGNWQAFQPANGQFHDIGPNWNNKWDSTGDMAIVRINKPGTDGWNVRPWVYVTNGPDTVEDPSYNIANDGGSRLNMRVCKTGWALGYTSCGKVTGLDLTRRYCGSGICVTVEHLGGASFCTTGGDSGGPVFSGHVAYGIVVAITSDNCHSLYQGVGAIETAMNVNVLHG
jgi:hypothetical protein